MKLTLLKSLIFRKIIAWSTNTDTGVTHLVPLESIATSPTARNYYQYFLDFVIKQTIYIFIVNDMIYDQGPTFILKN